MHKDLHNKQITVGAGRLGITLTQQNTFSPNRLARRLTNQGETGGRQGVGEYKVVSHLSRPYVTRIYHE